MRIDSRPSQWIGVLVIVAWTAFIAFALPRVANAIPNANVVAAGESVAVGGVSLTPGEGWSQPKDAQAILILRKEGAQITALPPQPATGDASAALEASLGPLRSDPSWQVDAPVAITTAAGMDGLYAVGQSSDGFELVAAFVADGQSHVVIASGAPGDWASLHDEIVATIKTLATGEAVQ